MTIATRRQMLAAGPVMLAAPALAQGRSVRLIVPYPPGGGTDTTGRVLAPRAAELLGQSWVIENRSGANGALGAEMVARSAPDGMTLLHSNEVLTALPFVQRNDWLLNDVALHDPLQPDVRLDAFWSTVTVGADGLLILRPAATAITPRVAFVQIFRAP